TDTIIQGTDFTNVISGSGQVIQMGIGKVILTGANTWSGGTTISNGTLQIGNGAAAGSIVSNVFNNGTLTFYRSDDYTFSGVISGPGSLVNTGNIVRLSAAQTYTGPTVINSGYLVLPTGVDNGLSTNTM